MADKGNYYKLEATILLEPVPKGRPKATRLPNGKVLVYTPAKTRQAEAAIRAALSEFCFDGVVDRGVPLYMEVTFYRPRPKALPKRVTMPVQKPDLDNYWKTLLDALEKFVYEVDSQITSAYIKKRFGSPPCIELTIRVDADVKVE